MIAALLCRLAGHRYDVEREYAHAAWLTMARCRRCGRWGALVEVKARASGRTEAAYGEDDAVAVCRRREA